jgi:hypothetical protein
VKSRTARDVKIALPRCGLDDNARPRAARTVLSMVDFLFSLGQAASVLFLVYGAVLILMPAKTKKAERDDMRLMHLRTHA